MIRRALLLLLLATATSSPAAERERLYSAKPSTPSAQAPQAAAPADLYRYDYHQPSAPLLLAPLAHDHVHDEHCRHDLPPTTCIVYNGLTVCQ